ncbi:hypothetical protein [Halobacillus sp. BBL2006]|uniref:hypothetical protein n=1 Tax=Halobacillus sp. BBL2006 TaxID=1543706 RepID=UPI00054261DF|nr:hypothetical protein [Halobacillus sp. BBL2006]KHE66881.1 hypothetical protein LD39_20435 [Halobacillus sp. BBL2006]
MYANQRISGPYFPSHSASAPDHEQMINEQLNHWCEEIDRCAHHHNEKEKSGLNQKSKIIKLAPATFMI